MNKIQPIFFIIFLILCVMESGCISPDHSPVGSPLLKPEADTDTPAFTVTRTIEGTPDLTEKNGLSEEMVTMIPSLTEDQAWDVAEAYFASKGITGITAQEKTVKGLWVYNDAANDIGWPKQDKKFLAWVFYVRHEGKWLTGGLIFVDAHDGHIINVAEIL